MPATLQRRGRLALGTAVAGSLVAAALTVSGGTAAQASTAPERARLQALNDSGAAGRAVVDAEGRRLSIKVRAHGLAEKLPHAQHIHWGKDARNECPSVFDDANTDHRLNVAEGVPAYGPILKSLTTKGDTSPKSGLAVDRFPTTPKGVEKYERTISFAPGAVLRAVKSGKGVVVIHGVDHNGNGTYDFDGAGASELDPSLPAEATDPALCGVLR